ncbi:MAG: LysR substrate-binding domain-containing protein [Alphaproteobacteria bacterium]|nr:LysR substrate-binding domain-containing protein [Alphaproteobacteria bacterium]
MEAVVRCGSFVAAARELGVSQVAISKKVKELETVLGVSLFDRSRPTVVPSDDARTLAEDVATGAKRLQATLDEIKARTARGRRVTLYASTSFWLFWLSPRWSRFHASHPGCEISLLSSVRSDEPDVAECDLAVIYGARRLPGFRPVPLFRDRVGPVASPDYVARRKGGTALTTLDEDVLLCVASEDPMHPDWTIWAETAGLPLRPGARKETFFDYGLLIDAAIEGRGLAMGWKRHIQHVLERGRLVSLEGPEIMSPGDYILWVRTHIPSPRAAMVRALVDWMLAECRAQDPLADRSAPSTAQR